MRRFISTAIFAFMIGIFGGPSIWAQQNTATPNLEEPSHANIKKKETSMYADFFEKNVYERGVQWLYIPRVVRKVFNIKKPSVNVNIYDELPDSSFFVNRIGRKDMTVEEIIKGPEITSGPDTGGPWTILKGKFEGITPGFFIKDAKGDKYLLKFDPPGYPELASGGEAIGSRIMYAFGYNVPQYTVVYFDPKILTIGENAKFYDKAGFNKPMTMQIVMDAIKDIDRAPDGRLRASASLFISGDLKGPMSFNSYRKEDPNDYFRHRNHREIRSWIVFNSWLNNQDLRKGNSLDSWLEQGKDGGYLKHYMIDFGDCFGSAGDRSKDPTFTFEYFIDYKDILFQAATLGLFEPDWKKRWEANHKTVKYPAAGNFDNLYFRPENWKPEIPHFAFDDMTPGDAFWASKIIMKLRPETLKGLMAVGQYSDKNAENYIYDILVERQKLIAQYWFSLVTPFDEFEFKSLGGGKVQMAFKDLEVFYNLTSTAPSYQYRILSRDEKGNKTIRQGNTAFNSSPLELDLSSFKSLGKFKIVIEKLNPKSGKWNPPVILTVSADASGDGFHLAGIWHADKAKK